MLGRFGTGFHFQILILGKFENLPPSEMTTTQFNPWNEWMFTTHKNHDLLSRWYTLANSAGAKTNCDCFPFHFSDDIAINFDGYNNLPSMSMAINITNPFSKNRGGQSSNSLPDRVYHTEHFLGNILFRKKVCGYSKCGKHDDGRPFCFSFFSKKETEKGYPWFYHLTRCLLAAL